MLQHYGVNIRWMTIACFEIHAEGIRILNDPSITASTCETLTREDLGPCDIITLSHGHWDHITDMKYAVEQNHPLLLCGDHHAEPMARWLNYTPTRIYPMYPDLELDFGDVKIKALYGRHTDLKQGYNDLFARLQQNEFALADPGIAALQGIGSLEYRNFLLTAPNGTKILLWGNDPTVEQMNLCKALQPDIAIIQRSTAEESIIQKAEFAAAIGCKVLIPHHHDFRAVDDPAAVNRFGEEFLKRVPDGTFISPKHGEWISL